MEANKWRCAGCGKVFEYCNDGTWTKEDAIAKKEACFPDVPMELCEPVCNDCYGRICINLNGGDE